MKKFKDIKPWYYINSDINEKNFPVPKEVSIEGWKVLKMDKAFTSEEALEYIKSQGCRPGTIHELALLADTHPELWKDNEWTSMIAFGTDFIDSDGGRGVPRVFRYSDGVWSFDLGSFGGDWVSGYCLFVLCDNKSSETQATKTDIDSLTDEQAIAHLKAQGYKITKLVEKEF